MDENGQSGRPAEVDRVEQRANDIYRIAGQILGETTSTRSVQVFAEHIRTRVGYVRNAIDEGDYFKAARILAWAENDLALTVERRKHVQLAPLVEYGRSIREGCKRPRSDALGVLIDRALALLPPRAPAKHVLDRMEEIDHGEVIQEVDRDDPTAPIIYWRGSRREKNYIQGVPESPNQTPQKII